MAFSNYFAKYGALRLAPMMGYTTAHMRTLIRLISPKTLNFTEMVTVNAMLHNPKPHQLAISPIETPTAFQIGGQEAEAAIKVLPNIEAAGFSEININVGCPSSRVQNGQFGACLMAQPKRVADMVEQLKQHSKLPITVKHRIGLNGNDQYETLHQFVHLIVRAGVDGIIVHNRTAFLDNKLSPRANRSVPPLKPVYSHWLKRDFPNLNVCANGEINTVDKVNHTLSAHDDLPAVDGVMIGRKAWSDPWFFSRVSEPEKVECLEHRFNVLDRYLDYMQTNLASTDHKAMVKPLSGFFNGLPGAKPWRHLVGALYNQQIDLTYFLTHFNRSESFNRWIHP